ncbi:hypothetical protein [Kitasatospora cinereorecta]|uniref:Integral membrane protein n=1 Tax=Kitasatospora cinereorecta TaxID=285560 RepID=A0ABW0V5I3_9ACTN
MTTSGEQWPVGPWVPPGWASGPSAPKPGTVPLRPLHPSDIISGVFATAGRYRKPLYLPLLVLALVCSLLLGGCAWAALSELGRLPADGGQPADGQFTRAAWVVGIAFGLALVCATVAYAATAALSTTVLGHAVLGRSVTAREAWAQARPQLGRVLGTQLLTAAAALGILAVSALPSILLGVTLNSPAPALYGLFMLVPGLIGALYLGVRLVIAVPVAVMERQRPAAAIRRAWQLNHGAWWRSLGVTYAVRAVGSAVSQTITSVVAAVALRLVLSDALTTEQLDVSTLSAADLTLLIVAVGGAVVLTTTLSAPLRPLAVGLLYLDRRMTRENLAAGLAAAAGLPPELQHG